MALCIQFFAQLYIKQGRMTVSLCSSLAEGIDVEGNDIMVGIKLDKSSLS